MEEIIEEMINEFEKNVKNKLLHIADERIRILYFLAWLNSFLERHGLGRIIIVRGFAVEFYTGAAVRTYDVDIDVESGNLELIRKFLKIVGERIGRGYGLTALRIIRPIEIVPSTHIRDFIRINVNGYWVYIWSIEATLVYLLAAWKYWDSEYDMYRAKILWNTVKDKIDMNKLCTLSVKEDVVDYLTKIVGREVCRQER